MTSSIAGLTVTNLRHRLKDGEEISRTVVGMRRMLAVLGVVAIVATGCGDAGTDPGDGSGDPSGSGTAPLTARAVAAVMLDHLPGDTTHRQAAPVDERSPKGLVGARLRYHGDGEYDGDLVEATVRRGRLEPCDAGDDHCTDLGDGVQLAWGLMIPEEDPGGVGVQRQIGDEVVTVAYSGPDITGDPRDLDLEISVEQLVEVATDPRLRLETDAETVAAGERLDDWSGGEVDPASLEEVPQTDATVVAGWIFGYGDAWRYVGPSPYKRLFGKDAVGGRVEVTGDMQVQRSGFLDALAAPRPPRWVTSGCLDGYRCGDFQGVRVVWRAARGDDPGDVFLVHVRRDGETVAVHNVGPRVPDRLGDAVWAAGFGLWSLDLTDPQEETRISLTTTREKRDRAARLARRHR